MTAEQLNIIITAQTADFEAKIAAVNKALNETAELSERLFSESPAKAKITDTNETSGASVNSSVFGIPDEALELIAPPFASMVNVLELDSNQTLVGAFSEKSKASESDAVQKPIEIYTTVELDGERLGEAITEYNEELNRTYNGFKN